MTVLMVNIGDERFTFDTSAVSGLDAWEFTHAVGGDLLEVLAEFGRLVESGQAPPFHLAVVGKWLAIRQGGYPLATFAGVAASTFVPAHDDAPAEAA
jgi:hypothetical protein